MNSYAILENDRLRLGNDLIERSIILKSIPISEYILNKSTGKYWRGSATAMFNIFSLTFSSYEFRTYRSTNDRLSTDHLCAELVWHSDSAKITQTFEVYDDSPFISCFMTLAGAAAENDTGSADLNETGIESDPAAKAADSLPVSLPPVDTIDYIPLSEPHLKVDSIILTDKTDGNDNYVSCHSEEIYVNRNSSFPGSIFVLASNDSGLMLVKEAPCIASQLSRTQNDLFVKPRAGGFASLVGSGISAAKVSSTPLPLYGSTVGVGSPDDLIKLYRRHYSKVFLGSELFAMSNTWGDRSRDTALCEEFMLRERECAEHIGVDFMQLDDGWQKGLSANSALSKSGVWTTGFYKSDPGFWNVNPTKFPSGLTPLMSDKTSLALWFSADGDEDYANHSRDAERLADLSHEYNIKQFKLDGTIIKNKLCEKNLIDFLTETRRLAKDVSFNLDITSGVRLGYLVRKEIGTIFVENRYTDWTNYYPHTTLKNLWQLSKLFPTRKFQFELLNNLRNSEKYEAAAPGDILAPANYDIDWLFASVMVSNPLFWMEMQHLTKEQTEKLANIVKAWKNERSALSRAEVDPIGSLPDGYAFTGFDAKLGGCGYLVLLCESGERNFEYDLDADVEVLASSGNFSYSAGKKLSVSFGEPRSYAFLRYIVRN